MSLEIIHITPMAGHRLLILFSDGALRVYDARKYVKDNKVDLPSDLDVKQVYNDSIPY